MRWPRRSTACTRQKSFINAVRGAICRPSSWRRSNGSTGSITGACSGRLATFHPPKPKRLTIVNSLGPPWGRDSSKIVSGKPGPIHLGLAALIASQPCRERDLALAMIASRIVAPHTKLATTRWWHTTTLADDFGVADADEDDLYAAMDWLLERQDTIQKKLASRHLCDGGLVLYDLSSSYFEGTTGALAKLGYNRDGKKGLLQVNYGLLTDARGCPGAVSVHEGNTADSRTFMPAVHKL